MNPHLRSIFVSLGKYFLLAVACSYPVGMLMLDILWLDNGVGEQSFTEFSQTGVLLIIIGLFAHIIHRYEDQRPFTFMAIGLFIAMLIREQDFYLNSLGPYLWETLMAITFITCVALSRRTRQPFAPVFSAYLTSKAGATMAIALISLLFYSRLLGMGVIWTSLLEEGYVRTVKNAIEEGTELYAYMLILYAALQYRAQLAQQK